MKMSVNQPESHDSVELAESAEPFMLLGLVVDIQESIPTWLLCLRSGINSSEMPRLGESSRYAVDKILLPCRPVTVIRCLLILQVTAIRRGMWDSLYDTFQAIGEIGSDDPSSTPYMEIMDVGPSSKRGSVSSNSDDIPILSQSQCLSLLMIIVCFTLLFMILLSAK